MKQKLKIMIDIAMTILFIFIMGYHQTGAFVHEWLGIILAVLFLLHNLLNWKWYSTIPKGKYSMQRTVRLVINMTLLIAFVGAMASGIMMSKHIFEFLNLQTTMFARRLHMLSTSWSFVLMSIHLGLHWSMVIVSLKKHLVKKWIIQVLSLACVSFGCYVFVEKQFWNEMFLLVDFVFLNYQESLIVFLFKQIALMTPFILLGYLMIKYRSIHQRKKYIK